MKTSKVKCPKLIIVVPCYNKEETLPFFNEKLLEVVKSLIKKELIKPSSAILYVDDGSSDSTWKLIKTYNKSGYSIGLKFSNNRGEQYALMAGMEYATNKCDICVTLGSDLKDDINIIEKMVLEYARGSEIVYAIPSEHANISKVQRIIEKDFYKVMNFFGSKIVANNEDFRLLSNKALLALLEYKESNLFLRGMIPEIGLPYTTIKYAKHQTKDTKQDLIKKMELVVEGVSAGSVKPMILIMLFGAAIAILAFLGLLVVLIAGIFNFINVFFLLLTLFTTLLGLTLLAIGYVGLVVTKTYSEVKARPRYIVEEVLEMRKQKDEVNDN